MIVNPLHPEIPMEPEAAELCTFCAGLIPPQKEPSSSRAHHPNLDLLEQSSKVCSICKVLLGHWSFEKTQRRFPEIDIQTYKSTPLEVELKEVQTIGPSLSFAILETNFHLRGFAFVDSYSITTCKTNSVNASKPIWRIATTSTPERISTLKTWLQDCELKHQKCRPIASQMPKRLIDVGSLDGRPARLIICKDLRNPYIRYATLSYCWGNATFCTTRENEKSHRHEIPYQLIPSTLQDAVTLTRHLNIQFLWIDALCIVQDDHKEWEIEASRMQDIYSGSSLTIAATDAVDSSVGCFFPNSSSERNLDKIGAFLGTRNTRDSSEAIVRVQPRDIRTSVGNSVLNTRGWVFQEMVLSHRVIHWMRSGLYWQCRSKCQTETGLIFDESMLRHGSIPVLPRDIPIGVNEIWWKWIESYSRRRFSFPEDRLPALSGIVRHYQMATKDTPVLGLWERSLHQDLLWMRAGELVEGDDQSPYRPPNIPSWTWLSCPCRIYYDFWRSRSGEDELDLNIHDHVKLIEWEVVWTSKPLASDVQSTRLVIDGPVREIMLSVAPKTKDGTPPYLDADNEKPDFARGPFPWKYSGQFDDGVRLSPTQYLCLLLRSRVYKYETRIKETFLILEHCSGTNMYRRVGIGNFSDESRSFDLTVRRTLRLV